MKWILVARICFFNEEINDSQLCSYMFVSFHELKNLYFILIFIFMLTYDIYEREIFCDSVVLLYYPI